MRWPDALRGARTEARVAGTACMFLTRLPVGRFSSGDPAVLARSTRWFPAVGLLVGALTAVATAAAAWLMPMPVVPVVALVVGVLVTGAFHEDGLADVADSAGAFDVERKLEIMRDSRVGTYGALALILLLLAKYALLDALLSIGVDVDVGGLAGVPFVGLFISLASAHVASRWATVYLMARFPYARPEAANRVVVEGVGVRRLAEASLVAIGCLLLVGLASRAAGLDAWRWWWPGAAMLLAALVAEACGNRFRRWFGGITGDCLGAGNQLVEVATLCLSVLLSTAPDA